MQRLIAGVITALIAGLLAAVASAPAHAHNIGKEGCTPGYWKNHTGKWEEAKPTTLFRKPFNRGTSGVLDDLTFLEALAGGGGKGVAGAERIMPRAATAAYLNAAHEGVGYPWRRHAEGLDDRPPLVPTVNAALRSGDRGTMLELAERLDADNNLGCPLN